MRKFSLTILLLGILAQAAQAAASETIDRIGNSLSSSAETIGGWTGDKVDKAGQWVAGTSSAAGDWTAEKIEKGDEWLKTKLAPEQGANPERGIENMKSAPYARPEAEDVVAHFKMAPHPEGGYYIQTYQSQGRIPASALPPVFGSDRSYSTAILFLLHADEKSHLHRIRQDEVWHFYLGGPLRLVMISPEGQLSEVILGPDILMGQAVQYVVPAGYWFGAIPLPGSDYSLVGCTVAPGFDFADFELGQKETLEKKFPDLKRVISDFVL